MEDPNTVKRRGPPGLGSTAGLLLNRAAIPAVLFTHYSILRVVRWRAHVLLPSSLLDTTVFTAQCRLSVDRE